MTTLFISGAQARDNEDHKLVKLWETYNKAENADKPKDAVEALLVIKKEAFANGYAWDWYDAGVKLISAKSRRDWKQRSALQSEFDREVLEYSEPVVRFYHRNNDSGTEMLSFVKDNRDKLLSSHNPEFYSRDWHISSMVFGDVLKDMISSDYDYCLWSLCSSLPEAYEFLNERVSGQYPLDALAEFTQVKKHDTDKGYIDRLNAYSKRWEGKAVALLSRELLLQERFEALESDRSSSSEKYIELKQDCESLVSEARTFQGSERDIANCCVSTDFLLETLNSKAITIEAESGKISVGTRNLRSVQLKLKQGRKVVYETALTNRNASFYTFDTLTTELPPIDDGEYTLTASNGNTETTVNYEKYTLSIAVKHDADSYASYVADYVTGEPVKSYKLALFNDMDTSIGSAETVSGEGFVYLPVNLLTKIDNRHSGVYLQASVTGSDGRLRLSRKRMLDTYYRSDGLENDPKRNSATVFTDRTAFNPDETVHFKTILYGGTLAYEVLSGRKLKAILTDSQGKTLDTRELITNEFGSAAGSFVLKKSERGGNYRISISENGVHRASTSVRVDEFVLPSFTLAWDSNERKYLPGDNIKVSGQLKSYSGHTPASAKLTYSVLASGTVLSSGVPEIKPDGSFSIAFKASPRDWESYRVTMKIVDGTGETLEFNTSLYSSKDISLSMTLSDAAEGRISLKNGAQCSILKGSLARIRISSGNDKKHPGLRISYVLSRDGKALRSGQAGSGEELELDLSDQPSGLYTMKATAEAASEAGTVYRDEAEMSFVKISDTDTRMTFDAECFFKKLEGDEIAVQLGLTSGAAWAVAELYGEGNVLLGSSITRLSGVKGKDGSVKIIRFPWKESYGEGLTLNILYFRDGRSFSYSGCFCKEHASYKLPLGFTRFEDRTSPAKDYVFMIKTAKNVECAVSIFDISTEQIASNVWRSIRAQSRPLPSVSYSISCGSDSSTSIYDYVARPMMTKRGAVMLMSESRVMNAASDMVEEAAVMEDKAYVEDSVQPADEIALRSDFQNTIAWEPQLRSDENGDIALRFRTSDKLSTYCVQLFAHDKAFNNSTLRREMLVSIPVKASIAEPLFLYEGDRYIARATVSSNVKDAVRGKLSISFLNGGDYSNAATIGKKTESVTIPSGGSLTFESELIVPDLNTLGILVRFDAEDSAYGSDAVFVSVPVYPAVQTITEAHSALLRAGEDRNALEAQLRSMFTNVNGSEAAVREISIVDMIREALPEKAVASSDNVLDQSDALWANLLIEKLGGQAASNGELAEMVKKISACRCEDGGYAWFAGMRSNALMTAVLLERFADMGEMCPEDLKAQTEAAVHFLDKTYFSDEARPYWMGWISMEQYLHVRAMYPEIELNHSGVSRKSLSAFRKAAKEYLVPGKERGLTAQIFAKARRLQTLQMLSASEDGIALAKALGIRLATGKKLSKSMAADVESLLQYAVAHKSGGIYYPNAVMPWRGLLEGELYAHNLLARLMGEFGHDEIAEGIRLWMMVQKETQKWSDDHACVEAVATVLAGKRETLETRVLALSGSVDLPFSKLSAAGNGFRVERKYSAVTAVDGKSVEKELKDGDALHVGDRIVARYLIWNEENRSFVRLTAPRPAALRPVQQLSGWYRGAYRNVLAEKSEYWFDTYPEENSEIVESFYVTQAGSFQTPVVSIESLYAPHYRANDSAASETTNVLPPM